MPEVTGVKMKGLVNFYAGSWSVGKDDPISQLAQFKGKNVEITIKVIED
jgi:hypothetical protein